MGFPEQSKPWDANEICRNRIEDLERLGCRDHRGLFNLRGMISLGLSYPTIYPRFQRPRSGKQYPKVSHFDSSTCHILSQCAFLFIVNKLPGLLFRYFKNVTYCKKVVY